MYIFRVFCKDIIMSAAEACESLLEAVGNSSED